MVHWYTTFMDNFSVNNTRQRNQLIHVNMVIGNEMIHFFFLYEELKG